jgi:hypothetical protein
MPNFITSHRGSISCDDPTWLRQKMRQAGAEFWNVDEGAPAVEHGPERIHLVFEDKHGFALFHYNYDNDFEPTGPWTPSEIIRPVKIAFAGKPYYVPEPQFLPRELAWKVIEDFCDAAGQSARVSWAPVYRGHPGWMPILYFQIYAIPDGWFLQQRQEAASKEFQANHKIVEETAGLLSNGDQAGAIRFLGPLPLNDRLESQLVDMAIYNKHLKFLDWLLTNHRYRLQLKPIAGIDRTRLSMLLENNCSAGNMEVVQLLVTKFGADIHARWSANSWNRAIESAVSSNNVDLVRWLLDQGANPNIDETFSECLSKAAMFGSLAMVKLLVERGAIVNPRQFSGLPPLVAAECAARSGGHEKYEYLKSLGARPGWELRGLSERPTIAGYSGPPEGSIEYHFGANNFAANPIAKELIGPDWPVTIHLFKGDDCWLLATEGMSIRPMTVPPEGDDEVAKECRYAELFLRLPPEWPVDKEWLNQPQNRWVLDWVMRIARWPHEHKTWFGRSAVIANGEPPQPFTEGLPFSCWLVTPTEEQFSRWIVNEEKIVRYYWIYPIFTE